MNRYSGIVSRRGSGPPIPLHASDEEYRRRGGEKEPENLDKDGGFESSSATDESPPGVGVVFVPRPTEMGTSSNLRQSFGRRSSCTGMLLRGVGSRGSVLDLFADLEDCNSSENEVDQDEDLGDAVSSEGRRPSLTRPSGGEEMEKDLLTEAQHYLSACALSTLYGHLRDMSERGYAAESRFDDIDVNRSERSHYGLSGQLCRRRFQRRGSVRSQRSAFSSLSGTVEGCEGNHSLSSFGSTEHDHDGLRAPGAPGCSDYHLFLGGGIGEFSEGNRIVRYLNNTRSAGSVVRRLLEELESTQRENRDVGSCCEEGRGREVGADHEGISEFRRWVEESHNSGGSQDAVIEGGVISQRLRGNRSIEAHRSVSTVSGEETLSSGGNNAGDAPPAAGEPSSQDRGGNGPRRRSTIGLMPSYFQSGSILASMMEQGIEIVYFGGDCPLDEVVYCLCVDRETRTVIAVFLGAVTVQSCMDLRMWERHNPIAGERYEGWSDRFRLHGRFCSPLLRQRRDTGSTKFDEISRRMDAVGRELCQDDNEGSSSYRVSVAGHGLGGALATIFGFYYAANAGTQFAAAAAPVRVYTFGAPRVGDGAFRSAHRHLEQMGRLGHARFVNAGDVVPLLPAFSLNDARVGPLFKHVGLRVVLHGTGALHSVDAIYPLEMGWFGELKQACSNNMLNNMLTMRGFGTNHSLSQYHTKLQLAVSLKEGIKTLEEYCQIWAGIYTPMGTRNESRETARGHFRIMLMFSFSILAVSLVCGLMAGFSTQEANILSKGCASLVGFQFEDVQESTSISDSSNQITHDKLGTPEEFNQMNAGKHNVIDAITSSDVPAPSQGIGIDAAGQEAQIPPLQAGLTFLNKDVLQADKWGISFPPSSHEVDSALILNVRRRAELSALIVEWEARSFARSHVVPTAVPAQLSLESKQEKDGSKLSKWP